MPQDNAANQGQSLHDRLEASLASSNTPEHTNIVPPEPSAAAQPQTPSEPQAPPTQSEPQQPENVPQAQAQGVSGQEPAPQPGQAPDTGLAAEQSQQAQQQQEQVHYLIDAAKRFGVDLSGYENDEQALQALLESNYRAQQLTQDPTLREYYQRRDDFQKWVQEQQQQQAQPEKPKFFDPPPYDPAWENEVYTTDADGNVVVRSDAPAHLVEKVQQYRQYIRDFQRRLATNPESVLDQWFETKAKEKFQEYLSEHTQPLARRQEAQNILTAHLPWIRDFGSGQFTPRGQQFLQAVEMAERYQIKDAPQQFQFAMDVMGVPPFARSNPGAYFAALDQQQAQPQPPMPSPQQQAFAGQPALSPQQQQAMQQQQFTQQYSQPQGMRTPHVTTPTAARQQADQEGMSLKDKLKANLGVE